MEEGSVRLREGSVRVSEGGVRTDQVTIRVVSNVESSSKITAEHVQRSEVSTKR